MFRSSASARRGAITLLLALLSACESGGGAPPAAVPEPPEDLTLGPGDAFEVHVYDEENLSGKYRVSDDGSINYPLVGKVAVAGKTTSEIADAIQTALREGQFLQQPHVSVFLIEQTSRQISVMGAVKQPGSFTMRRGMTAVQALSLAGGLTPLANANSTIVTRRVEGQLKRFTVAVERVTEGRADDFVLEPGDIVYVPERLF